MPTVILPSRLTVAGKRQDQEAGHKMKWTWRTLRTRNHGCRGSGVRPKALKPSTIPRTKARSKHPSGWIISQIQSWAERIVRRRTLGNNIGPLRQPWYKGAESVKVSIRARLLHSSRPPKARPQESDSSAGMAEDKLMYKEKQETIIPRHRSGQRTQSHIKEQTWEAQGCRSAIFSLPKILQMISLGSTRRRTIQRGSA